MQANSSCTTCVCGHDRDDHEDLLGLSEPCEVTGCRCGNWWPEDRRAEFERRQAALAHIHQQAAAFRLRPKLPSDNDRHDEELFP